MKTLAIAVLILTLPAAATAKPVNLNCVSQNGKGEPMPFDVTLDETNKSAVVALSPHQVFDYDATFAADQIDFGHYSLNRRTLALTIGVPEAVLRMAPGLTNKKTPGTCKIDKTARAL